MRFLVAFLVLPGLVALFVLILFSFAPSSREASLDGGVIYRNRCASCHQPDGSGVPGIFPPLSGTRRVLGDQDRLIRLVLRGLTGAVTVDSVTYNGAMPGWAGMLSDEEIAAVLTFVRSSWGNGSPAVAAAGVAHVRMSTAHRQRPYNASDLEEASDLEDAGNLEEASDLEEAG